MGDQPASKARVAWIPELHLPFVDAVNQLGGRHESGSPLAVPPPLAMPWLPTMEPTMLLALRAAVEQAAQLLAQQQQQPQ
jgi:hypothetical protein